MRCGHRQHAPPGKVPHNEIVLDVEHRPGAPANPIMDLNPRIPAALASEDPMEYSEAARIVCLLYAYCLKRNPGAAELESWVDIVLRGTPISEIIAEAYL